MKTTTTEDKQRKFEEQFNEIFAPYPKDELAVLKDKLLDEFDDIERATNILGEFFGSFESVDEFCLEYKEIDPEFIDSLECTDPKSVWECELQHSFICFECLDNVYVFFY